jgi:hypothetical protein
MIELINVDGLVSIGIEITGYQFPDNPHDDWCLVKISAKQGDKLFERIDPALEASELVRLHQWLKALSEYRLPRFANLCFTEPCISFQFLACVDGQVRFSITLSDELRPTVPLEQLGVISEEWIVVFDFAEGDFSKALSGVSEAMIRLPIRNRTLRGADAVSRTTREQ